MKALRAKILKKDVTFNLNEASNFFNRLVGLMGKKIIPKDGLLIRDCKSIHSCFMFLPIDVVFIDKQQMTIKVLKNFKPWRMSSLYFRADTVLEFRVGILPESLEVGDQWEFEYV